VSKQNLNAPPLAASDTLTIVTKWIKNEKVLAFQSKGAKNSKKHTIQHHKGRFPNTQNIPHITIRVQK
jgi:hypothetical protein